MVSDKFQARAASGPNDPVTSQPVKGRARGGGVRMGEMERDGIISHGCANIARDRLFQCSDYAVVNLCSSCGNLLAPTGKIRQKLSIKISVFQSHPVTKVKSGTRHLQQRWPSVVSVARKRK